MAKRSWLTHGFTAIASGFLVWLVLTSSRDGDVAKDRVEAEVDPAQAGMNQGEESRPQIGAALIEIDRLEAALSAAEAQIVQLENALTANDPLAREQDIAVPEGYGASDYRNPASARPVYESEAIDTSWAGEAGAEIYQFLSELAIDDGLQLAGQEVQCRTETCRVRLTHIDAPRNGTELNELYVYLGEMMQELTNESKNVGGATIGYRVGYAGEPATNEIYLFRSGNSLVHSFDVAPDFPTAAEITIPTLGGENR